MILLAGCERSINLISGTAYAMPTNRCLKHTILETLYPLQNSLLKLLEPKCQNINRLLKKNKVESYIINYYICLNRILIYTTSIYGNFVIVFSNVV